MGCVGLLCRFLSFKSGFVSFEVKKKPTNLQAHIFKLNGVVGLLVGMWVCGFVCGSVGFAFNLVCGLWVCSFVLQAQIVMGQGCFHVLNPTKV